MSTKVPQVNPMEIERLYKRRRILPLHFPMPDDAQTSLSLYYSLSLSSLSISLYISVVCGASCHSR